MELIQERNGVKSETGTAEVMPLDEVVKLRLIAGPFPYAGQSADADFVKCLAESSFITVNSF